MATNCPPPQERGVNTSKSAEAGQRTETVRRATAGSNQSSAPETKTRLLNEREAAARLGTTAKTLNVARARGAGAFSDLAYVKIGASVKFAEPDIEAYIQAHRIDPQRCHEESVK